MSARAEHRLRPAETTGREPAFTVFSAYSGKVYACCVTLELALGWAAPYGGRREQLLALAPGDSWRSHPDARAIAVMRVS